MKNETKPTYRIKIVADQEPYEIGDGNTPEELVQIHADIDSHGVWGFVVEKLYVCTCHACDCPVADTWTYIDSCFGFIGNDDGYMMEQALCSIPEDYGDVQVVDEDGQEINTASK